MEDPFGLKDRGLIGRPLIYSTTDLSPIPCSTWFQQLPLRRCGWQTRSYLFDGPPRLRALSVYCNESKNWRYFLVSGCSIPKSFCAPSTARSANALASAVFFSARRQRARSKHVCKVSGCAAPFTFSITANTFRNSVSDSAYLASS